MNNHSVEIFNPTEFDPGVADELVAAINEAIQDNGSCNLVLAGGKTPAGIYRLLSRPPRSDLIDWTKVRFFWSDERFVPAESSNSNYHLVAETLFHNLSVPEENIFKFNTELDSAKSSVVEFSSRVRKFFKLGDTQLPKFDIVLLGVGEDGHTASIFPGDTQINSHELAIAVEADAEISQRISLTLYALQQSSRIYFIVRGKGKADIVAEVLKSEQYPACFYKKAQSKVTWFLDADAAKNL